VLVNYTHEPILRLRVTVRLPHAVAKAVSTEGAAVAMAKADGGITLELPLDGTDIVLLPAP
jgi:hypothetical protein